MRRTHLALLLVLVCGISAAAPTPKKTDYPSEIPAKFTPTTDGMDFTRRAVDIAMRDGVKLHTVILVPKGAKRAPMLLTRTPYEADSMTARNDSTHLRMAIDG